MYIYTNVKLFLNSIFIFFVTSFDFEARIIYMWFKNDSKWVKSYMLLFFISYVVLNFLQIMYIVVCIHFEGVCWMGKSDTNCG